MDRRRTKALILAPLLVGLLGAGAPAHDRAPAETGDTQGEEQKAETPSEGWGRYGVPGGSCSGACC